MVVVTQPGGGRRAIDKGRGEDPSGLSFPKGAAFTHTHISCMRARGNEKREEREKEEEGRTRLHVERCVDHCSPCSDEDLSVVYVHALICR